MIEPSQLSLDQWDRHYERLTVLGLNEPWYGGPLSRHVKDGDTRLKRILFDNSREALELWNFLLSENVRLRRAREDGKRIIATMKDLGTIPVMAYSHPELVAFYPDGAWWIPCVMESNTGLLEIADRLGVGDSFCPVRAMLGAFATGAHFPIPDFLICSAGATCDDFSAIAQRVEGLGYPIFWWEMPHRREVLSSEAARLLPGDIRVSADQVAFVMRELERIKKALSELAGSPLTDEMLTHGISKANQVRTCLNELRETVFMALISPLPSLELLIAEMLAIHYCSDREEALRVLQGLLDIVKARVSMQAGYFGPEAVRVFWINPVADIKVMNLLEKCGGKICGTEYLFTHALDPIPTDVPPLEALACMALADPMVGSGRGRALRICRDIRRYRSEAVVISKIPGASHCALEGAIIKDTIDSLLDVPIVEIEVPSVSDTFETSLKTRLSALMETVKEQRKKETGHVVCRN